MYILYSIFPNIFIAQSYLLCYQCVSTHPGCGTPFKWLWHKTVSCPEEDDICVKVIEKIGGMYIIIYLFKYFMDIDNLYDGVVYSYKNNIFLIIFFYYFI